VLVLYAFCIFFGSVCLETTGTTAEAEEVIEGILGRIVCIRAVENTDIVYVGTEKGLYITENSGIDWKKANIPDPASKIRDIAVGQKNIFVLTQSSIYTGKASKGSSSLWEWISESKGFKGINVFSTASAEEESVLIAWSKKDLFRIEAGTWKSIKPVMIQEEITDVLCCDGVIFAASGRSIYCLSESKGIWEKTSLFGGHNSGQDEEETYTLEEDELELPIIRDIASSVLDGIAVATVRGIFILGKNNELCERIDTMGLGSSRLKYVAYTSKGLFAATDTKLFVYSDSEKSWRTFFEKTFPGSISCLDTYTDKQGRIWLWIAAGRYLYKQCINLIQWKKIEPVNGQRFLEGLFREISIRDVHQMAIEYAEVSPEKIKRWRVGAKWKPLMPRLSMGFSESNDDNIAIDKGDSVSTSYIVTGPREIGRDWNIDLTWDLADLVWNDSQTVIDVRSKLMVQLRDDIIEEVTRLYFARKRLITEIARLYEKMKKGSGEVDLSEKIIRLEELTAYFDGFTGGKFSIALESQ